MMTTAPAVELPRRVLRNEVLLVLGVSLGASALLAVLRIAERLTRGPALSEQTAALNVSRLLGILGGMGDPNEFKHE